MKWFRACARSACVVLAAVFVVPGFAADDTPLTLRRAIDAALAGNPELQAFAFEFRAQDARIAQARLRPATELNLDVENILGSGEVRGAESAELTLGLSQVIELGDKRDARVGSASAARDLLRIDRQARQLDVLAEVTRRFITVVTRQEQLALADKAMKLAEQTVAGAKTRVSAAKSPHAELDRADIGLDRARLDAKRAMMRLDISRKQLAAMWGESQPVIDGQPMRRVAADLYALPEAGDFAALVARLERNPDFLRFASEARVRDAELRLAATLRRPDLTIGAGIRRLQAGKDEALVASFSMPLFSGNRARSHVAEAQANRDLVDAGRRIAEIKARTTLYELHRELRTALEEATSLRDDVIPRAAEALRETQYAYERGRYGYVELIDAQREFLALQTALIDASSNAQALRVEIERLTAAPLAPDTH
jgi:cobalt-zinc-cadmium efflux system outer membrane protein